MSGEAPIIDAIGEEPFRWLSRTFDRKTTLRDVPEAILERVAAVDITVRDYGSDLNSITAIALITFAYQMAGRSPSPRSGPKDILLAKVLAGYELSRRRGGAGSRNPLWEAPLFDIIMGAAGEWVRAMGTINSPP